LAAVLVSLAALVVALAAPWAPDSRLRDPELAHHDPQRQSAQADEVVVALDEPAPGAVLTGHAAVVGWAADLAPDGPGIDPTNVQVWIGGASGTPLGFAQYGWQRDDVAGRLGQSRYARTGFRLGWEACTFPPGPYQVVAYAWRQDSAVAGLASLDVSVGPCAQAPGSILFADSLDGGNRLWPTGASVECALRYEGGEYHVHKLGAAGAEDCAPPDVERTVYGDFALEVDVRLLDPSPSRFASVAFRSGIAEFSTRYFAGYAVHLNPVLGTVELVDDLGTSYTRLAAAQPTSVRAGGATNRVGIVAAGSRIQVLVNGETALEIDDDRHVWGTIGIGAGAPRGDEAQAAFRNLVVRRL
jgi:hypothetical protein